MSKSLARWKMTKVSGSLLAMQNHRPNQRVWGLPSEYEPGLKLALSNLGYGLDEPRRLADAVLRLSDHYTQNPLAATPWAESWAQAASLAYYFPLNYARNASVALEAKRTGFLEGLENVLDFGSGTASALFAFADRLARENQDLKALRFFALDVSSEAMTLGQNLRLPQSPLKYEKLESNRAAGRPLELPKQREFTSKLLITSSYALTELAAWPEWFFEAEALAIVEPSTQEDGRKLMAAREDLMSKGYRLWAPCTHEGACPLLVGSAKDWCHDRIHWAAPQWFLEMEKHLPMKNRTLTFSYLLARRAPPPAVLREHGRLVGDMLIEKGKTRQAYCRSSEREFLAWFPQRFKKGEELTLERGNLLREMKELEKRATEVRVPTSDSVTEVAPGAALQD